MAREAPGCKQQNINALVVTPANEARSDGFRRGDDTPQPPRINRQVEFGRAAAPFHLDEGYRSAASRNKVDLPAGCFYAPRKNPPALEPQIPRRQRFPAPAKTLPLGAIHFSSIARA